MKSIRSIYKIGLGPSSSHTMGPAYAAADFLRLYADADHIKATLFGSLAKTGSGNARYKCFKSCKLPFCEQKSFL